jgi:hypothetical protein
MFEGEIKYQNGSLTGPDQYTVAMKITMPNKERINKRFSFSAKDIDFE